LSVRENQNGKLVYPSNDYPLEYMGASKTFAKIPKLYFPGQCLYFDLVNYNYGSMPCDSKAITVCYIKKSSQLIKDRLFWETINDKINEINSLKISDRIKSSISQQLERIRKGHCEEEYGESNNIDSFDLIDIMSVRQPIEYLNELQQIDKSQFYTLYPEFTRDINYIKKLFNSENLESEIRQILDIPQNILIEYDNDEQILCINTDWTIDLSKEQATQLPRVISQVESNSSTETVSNSSSIFHQLSRYGVIELTLAACAAISTLVAIINTICLLIMSARKREVVEVPAFLDETNEINDMELTPLNMKKVQFGEDQISHYEFFSSAETLPSPRPALRRKQRD